MDPDRNHQKVRVGKEIRTPNLEEALSLVRAARSASNVWLRGQCYPWPPCSSLSRIELSELQMRDPARRLSDFLDWVDRTSEVQRDLSNDTKAIATAQHYGIPTYFLDFTTSPAVAAFFASDYTTEPPGPEACIYLLDLKELADHASRESRQNMESLQVYPIDEAVPNLWRLESQEGKFLNAPGKWWEWFEMDRVVFPREAANSRHRTRIYPRERSALELRLDGFFQWERIRTGQEWIRENYPQLATVYASTNVGIRSRYMKADTGPHNSWRELEPGVWSDRGVEEYATTIGYTIGLGRDLLSAPGLHTNILGNICQFIDKGVLPRDKSALFVCEFEVGLLVSGDLKHLDQSLQRVWDGMRRLPYAAEQIARAMANAVWLASDGVGWWQVAAGKSPAAVLAERLKEDWIMIELGSDSDSYSRAVAPSRALRRALRSDLDGVLNTSGQALNGDLRYLLQVVREPQFLFDAEHFVDVLAEYLIPSQALLASAGSPVLYSPREIKILGLP